MYSGRDVLRGLAAVGQRDRADSCSRLCTSSLYRGAGGTGGTCRSKSSPSICAPVLPLASTSGPRTPVRCCLRTRARSAWVRARGCGRPGIGGGGGVVAKLEAQTPARWRRRRGEARKTQLELAFFWTALPCWSLGRATGATAQMRHESVAESGESHQQRSEKGEEGTARRSQQHR